MMDIWRAIFAWKGFMPHGHCYMLKPGLIWLHVISDSLIGLAYVAISYTLVYLVYRGRRDIPFHSMFLAFGGRIELRSQPGRGSAFSVVLPPAMSGQGIGGIPSRVRHGSLADTTGAD